ncbi:MAG TPA: glucose 1-dehydrogenase [Acidimicrobiales bacterium]|nr:glucose 1-dehydrogenase [Acidimicrobiales bacterium]
MNPRFEGRTAVVTGAASGIGSETVRLLVDEGARVLGVDLDPTHVPSGASTFAADVSDPAEVNSMIAAAIDEFGHVDILCNNAGIGSVHDVLGCDVEEWDRLFAVNVRGVFLGIKAALPSMLERGHGVIVNTASVAGMMGLRDRAAYCASKGAVISLTQQVAVQYAGTGVRCNCVCPGTVDSPWVGRLLAQADDPALARDRLVARQPLGRLGQPTEVAKAILYLASDDAAFMTGSSLVIDGGMTVV